MKVADGVLPPLLLVQVLVGERQGQGTVANQEKFAIGWSSGAVLLSLLSDQTRRKVVVINPDIIDIYVSKFIIILF